MYYIFVENEKIIGKGQCKQISEKVLNISVEKEVYDNADKYMVKDGFIVLNPNYEEELKQQEAERIAMLNLTAADVERAIYKVKGLDFEDIIRVLSNNPQEGLDLKALKIELKANNFYRGNSYVSAIGQMLGFTEKQLDKFFEDGNYEHLLESEVEDV